MSMMESFVQEPLDGDLYVAEHFSTPVKQFPPSFGYGNSSSPAYESPPTVGKSMRANIGEWSTDQFDGGDSYFKQASTQLLPPQFPPVRYESLESSPPEINHTLNDGDLLDEFDVSPLRKKRGNIHAKHFIETNPDFIGRRSNYMDPALENFLPEEDGSATDSFVLRRVTRQRAPRKPSVRTPKYQKRSSDQPEKPRSQLDSEQPRFQFPPQYMSAQQNHQQFLEQHQQQQKFHQRHQQQHQNRPQHRKRSYLESLQPENFSSDKIHRPIPIRRQLKVHPISRISPPSDSYSQSSSRSDLREDSRVDSSTNTMQQLISPPSSLSQSSDRCTPTRHDRSASSWNIRATAFPSWSVENPVTLYTEKDTKPAPVFSSKVFQLACENQKSLNDPNAKVFKGLLAPYEPSKRQFTRKGAALKFSINHRGYVSIDATTPPAENSKNSIHQTYKGLAIYGGPSPKSDFAASCGDSNTSSSGYSVAQSLLGDDSDSDSEGDYFPHGLETPPRFSSLGNTDATTAFARTLARARDGKDSTFLFPIETTPDKYGQMSSYVPCTPRAPLTFDEVNFNTQMQTPPGAMYSFDSVNDIYGTGMTPYFNGAS